MTKSLKDLKEELDQQIEALKSTGLTGEAETERQLEILKEAGWAIREPIVLDPTDYEKEQLRKAKEAGDDEEYFRLLGEMCEQQLGPRH